MNRLLEALHSGRVLVMDGAMGTELQRLGLRDDECSALWNLTHPEQVARVHMAYLEAGAEVLLTNTFLAHREALAECGSASRLAEIWDAARAVTQLFRDPAPIVLADVGPFEIARLPVQARSVDGVLLETWSCTEMAWPLPPLPVDLGIGCEPALLSFTFRHGPVPRTNMGAQPEDCAIAAQSWGAAALGVNCGVEIGMDDLLVIVRGYREIADDVPVFIRPNAGTPKRTAAGWQYPRSPEEMADKLWPLLEAGVTMVGGCCGTTPAHIAAFRRVVDEWNARK